MNRKIFMMVWVMIVCAVITAGAQTSTQIDSLKDAILERGIFPHYTTRDFDDYKRCDMSWLDAHSNDTVSYRFYIENHERNLSILHKGFAMDHTYSSKEQLYTHGIPNFVMKTYLLSQIDTENFNEVKSHPDDWWRYASLVHHNEDILTNNAAEKIREFRAGIHHITISGKLNEQTMRSISAAIDDNLNVYKIYLDLSACRGLDTLPRITKVAGIKLPDDIKVIAKQAIGTYNGQPLEYFNFPKELRVIEDSAFRDVILPDINLPSKVEKIGQFAFVCNAIDWVNDWEYIGPKQIHIPASVREIGDNAFAVVNYGADIDVSADSKFFMVDNHILYSRDKSVLHSAFKGVHDNVSILPGCKEIRSFAFYVKRNIKSVEMPASVTTIGDGAFVSCYELSSVKLSPNLTYIGKLAFADNPALTHIDIPDKVTVIDSTAFKICKNLKTIKLSKSLQKIGEEAFSLCANLDVVIPKSVRHIGKLAFNEVHSVSAESPKNWWIRYKDYGEDNSFSYPNGTRPGDKLITLTPEILKHSGNPYEETVETYNFENRTTTSKTVTSAIPGYFEKQ